MTAEEIRKKLDELYADKKARNFFNHLVRAYFPVSKVEKVFSKPRGPFQCVLTKEPLISTTEILEGVRTKEFEEDFHKHLKSMFDTASNAEHPMMKLIGDRKMGVSAPDTTTNMAFTTFQVFYDWIATKILMGDKHVNWLLKDMQRKDFLERASTIEDKEVQKKVKTIKKTENKQATFALGELEALQRLKEKMDK